jgi:hypothetical protein
MKVKKVKQGKCQNVGNPYFGRSTVARTEDRARAQLATNNYKKGETPELFPEDNAEGVAVYPRPGLSGPRGS